MDVSNSFKGFMENAPEVQEAMMKYTTSLNHACSLDRTAEILAYVSVLASARLESGK